jgi:hypothetical protein
MTKENGTISEGHIFTEYGTTSTFYAPTSVSHTEMEIIYSR